MHTTNAPILRLYNTIARMAQSLFDTGKPQLTHEYMACLLKGVETATGLLQLLRGITFSGSRHSPMKCTDVCGPSLNRHRGGSSRNGSTSKFSNMYLLRLWTSSLLLKAVFG